LGNLHIQLCSYQARVFYEGEENIFILKTHQATRSVVTFYNSGPRFSSDEEVDFILDAVAFVASEGWKLMPQYIFNNETAEWKHHTDQVSYPYLPMPLSPVPQVNAPGLLSTILRSLTIVQAQHLHYTKCLSKYFLKNALGYLLCSEFLQRWRCI
jgi:hypothetical protein